MHNGLYEDFLKSSNQVTPKHPYAMGDHGFASKWRHGRGGGDLRQAAAAPPVWRPVQVSLMGTSTVINQQTWDMTGKHGIWDHSSGVWPAMWPYRKNWRDDRFKHTSETMVQRGYTVYSTYVWDHLHPLTTCLAVEGWDMNWVTLEPPFLRPCHVCMFDLFWSNAL